MTASSPRDDDLLAAEYVLGVLPAAEREAFAARLAREETLRRRVIQWEQRLAPLADGISETPPPEELRARIMAQLPQAQAAQRPAPRVWPWRWATGALAAALVLVSVLLFRQAPPQAVYLAEIVSADQQVRVLAVYESASGLVRVDRRAGTRAAGRDMELWLIAGKDPPRSLGLMPEQPTGALVVPAALREAVTTATLAISDEPAGGSPTGLPTGAILATGTVHSL